MIDSEGYIGLFKANPLGIFKEIVDLYSMPVKSIFNSQIVIIGCSDGKIIKRTRLGNTQSYLQFHEKTVTALQFYNQAQCLLSVGEDRRIVKWNL